MAAHVAKGPLQSAFGQWSLLGLGAYGILGGDKMSEGLQSGLRTALRLSAGDGVDAALLRSSSSHPQAPIVIHTGGDGNGSSSRAIESIASSLLRLSIGACVTGCVCWASYVVITTCLPDAVKELLPVTRKFFDNAVTSLGHGILSVRDALAEQIVGLQEKQDELSDKQDATHAEVLEVKDGVADVRTDLDDVHGTVKRCESSLEEAARRQGYTANGVRLLVRCVGGMLRGVPVGDREHQALAAELEAFGQLEATAGEEVMSNEEGEMAKSQQTTSPPRSPVQYPESMEDNPQQHTPAPPAPRPKQTTYYDGPETPSSSPESELPDMKEDAHAWLHMIRNAGTVKA